MESYPSFTEFPRIVSILDVTAPTCDAYDPSLPADNQFVTQVSQFQIHPPVDQPKSRGVPMTPQTWWNGHESNSNAGYLPTDYTIYPEPVSPWNSAISTISDPQSPRSSNSGSAPSMSCVASPPFRNEDLPVTPVGEQSVYPASNSMADLDCSAMIPKPPIFDVQPNHLSPYEPDFGSWSSSQSDRNGTPGYQCSTPLPTPTAYPQSTRRSKPRSTSTSRIHKTSERNSALTSGRSRKRRGVTSGSNGDNGTPRVFVCSFAPYGCQSTFVSKNEWKRHVTSKHLQLGFYRCDVGKCNVHTHQSSSSHCLTPSLSPKSTSSNPAAGQPNDFNRKDLFTQHQRRMHPPWLQSGQRRKPTDIEHNAFEESLEQVRQRCWHSLRHPPQQSHCGFCRELFTGEGSWDARMEHVGRHFEQEDRANLGEELEDLSLRDWGLREGILTLAEGKCRLASLVGVEL